MTRASSVFRPIDAKIHMPHSRDDGKHKQLEKQHGNHHEKKDHGHHHHHHKGSDNHHDKNEVAKFELPNAGGTRKETLPQINMILNQKNKNEPYVVLVAPKKGDGDLAEAKKRIFAADGSLMPPSGYDDRHVKQYGNNTGPHVDANKEENEVHHHHGKKHLGNNEKKGGRNKDKGKKKLKETTKRVTIMNSISTKLNDNFYRRRANENARENSPKGACFSFMTCTAIAVAIILLA